MNAGDEQKFGLRIFLWHNLRTSAVCQASAPDAGMAEKQCAADQIRVYAMSVKWRLAFPNIPTASHELSVCRIFPTPEKDAPVQFSSSHSASKSQSTRGAG